MTASTSQLSEQESEPERNKSNQILPSEKNYAVAVSLSAIFGVVGVHHFYLGRYLEGLFDLGLMILALVLYLSGYPLWALLVFAIDSLHTLIVTIMLLTGSIKDGRGRLVCYPGQRLSLEK